MKNKEFEHLYCLALVEEILFQRDRNPNKDWGHLWGITTIYSYSRWNKRVYRIPVPQELTSLARRFASSDIELYGADFSPEQNSFLMKYLTFSLDEMRVIDPEDETIYPDLSRIVRWYHAEYTRSSLGEVGENPLLAFLYGISKYETHEHDYYFCFCESIDHTGIEHLLRSWKGDPDFLFTNIAIASYFYQEKNGIIAQKYYIQALKLDPNNPWVLGKYAMLLASFGGYNSSKTAEKLLQNVTKTLPESPWGYDWYGDILSHNGRYIEALAAFEKYEHITFGKYRTFEPYMKRAEVYLALGDGVRAKKDLSLEGQYYFGEGYRERLESIKSIVGDFCQKHHLS